MTSDNLREVLRAAPFHPFILHLAYGRQIEVRHPEMMAISPSGRIAYVFEEGGRHDSGHHIDVLMITDVEIRARGGGADRRRRAG